ncbi:kinase-like domain-containing protein [Blastocladiella britannica]|nr:kinase-like domain-containing protein [Blastocladiella britannica]
MTAATAPTGQKTFEVARTELGFDLSSLVLYLYQQVPGFIAPLRIEKFALGQSNPTFLLVDGREQKYVLRKKPAGALMSPTAHAVEREFKVLQGLGRASDVPVPRMYALCTDSTVIGTPFYIMQFVKGRIFPSPALPELPKAERRKYWQAAVDALARLHTTDIDAAGLGDYGSRSGYYQRQLRTLLKVSDTQGAIKDAQGRAVGPMPGRDALKSWFAANLPKDETTVIQGDFKFDNLVFHPDRPEVIAILDWELSTLGHPLSDLANLMMGAYLPAAVGANTPGGGYKGEEHALGLPTRREVLDMYAKSVGRPPIANFSFFAAFVFFKFSVIAQGIRARMYRGQASSKNAAAASTLFEVCARIALEIAKGESKL